MSVDSRPPQAAGGRHAPRAEHVAVGHVPVAEKPTIDGDKTLTASLLGITARTIYRREAEWASGHEAGEDDDA